MENQMEIHLKISELEKYIRSTIHIEATYLSRLVEELYEKCPVSEDGRLISYLLRMLAIASSDAVAVQTPDLGMF
jgi:hypothetical protein